jgi:hypothetical protein
MCFLILCEFFFRWIFFHKNNTCKYLFFHNSTHLKIVNSPQWFPKFVLFLFPKIILDFEEKRKIWCMKIIKTNMMDEISPKIIVNCRQNVVFLLNFGTIIWTEVGTRSMSFSCWSCSKFESKRLFFLVKYRGSKAPTTKAKEWMCLS